MKVKIGWKRILAAFGIALISGCVIFAFYWRNTDIPKLYFEGDISNMLDKSDERKISFRYEGDDQSVSGFASIKIQGTSSIAYDKKNYTVKFYADESHEEKCKIDMGWGAQYKYCMKANWIDRTHARNVVSAKLVGKMQQAYGLLEQTPNGGAVDGFPVEIYSNGEFLGLYTFNIPKDEWQFAMDSENPDHIVLSGEDHSDACQFRADPDFENWSVEVGEESEETLAKLERLNSFVKDSSDEDFREHFGEYLNLDAALNYYVFTELAYLRDNLDKNMLIATYDGNIWYLSLYDLDSSWGTHVYGLSLFPYEEKEMTLSENNLFARMEKNFSQEIAQRYMELRKGILSDESILSEFYDFEDRIPDLTYLKDTIRWGTGVIRRREELPGFEIEQIEQFLKVNGKRLDEKYAAILEK